MKVQSVRSLELLGRLNHRPLRSPAFSQCVAARYGRQWLCWICFDCVFVSRLCLSSACKSSRPSTSTARVVLKVLGLLGTLQ
ncbi:hypothetical protein O3P69_003641 [Scylla paramamosain]|uniref:Secreted protein n=1 Tax=Scylla paramamosain TaxID=85552 RepID=A0AAW0UI02_SCYPA